jgi:hypothetical protein
MPDRLPPPWQWQPWHPDTTRLVERVELPEAGGWLYRFRNPDGLNTSTFVPNLSLWAAAIAAAIHAPVTTPVSVFSNLAAAKTIKQSIPT